MYITKAGRQFRQDVYHACLLQGVRQPLLGKLRVAINLYAPTRALFDIDNTLKASFDAMEYAGVYQNDNQIRKLILEDTEKLGGYIEVIIDEHVSCGTKTVL